VVGVRGIRGVEAGFGRVDDGDYPDRGWRSVVRTLRSCGRASKGIGRDACVMWRVEVVKRREGVVMQERDARAGIESCGIGLVM